MKKVIIHFLFFGKLACLYPNPIQLQGREQDYAKVPFTEKIEDVTCEKCKQTELYLGSLKEWVVKRLTMRRVDVTNIADKERSYVFTNG